MRFHNKTFMLVNKYGTKVRAEKLLKIDPDQD